jgi:hypothetical protein
MIVTSLLALACAPDAAGQKRGTRKRTRPAQSTAQTPKPPPASPQKSAEELALEREIALLSKLTPEQRATVRAALEGLDRTVQVRQLRGYDERFIYRLETTRVEELIKEAYKVLPSSILKNLMTATWNGLFDSWKAETAYREGGKYREDQLLEIVDRYQLKGQPGVLIGNLVFERAAVNLSLAFVIAEQAQIVPPSEP